MTEPVKPVLRQNFIIYIILQIIDLILVIYMFLTYKSSKMCKKVYVPMIIFVNSINAALFVGHTSQNLNKRDIFDIMCTYVLENTPTH